MTPNLPEDLFFDLVNEDEVEGAAEVEKRVFPPGEAGSLETFKKRQSLAPKLFLGAFISPRTLVGYANATLASTSTLTHYSMSGHDPSGTSVCIHAVAVTESHQRRGIATALMGEYAQRLREDPRVGDAVIQRILLICHQNLIPLYERVGFKLVGKSPVVHGPDPWFEMRLDLEDSLPPHPETLQAVAHGAIPPDVLAALTSPTRNRPSARSYSSFSSSQELISSDGENALDILCPRPGCGSIVLKAGTAIFQKGPTFELEPHDRTPSAPLKRLPSPPAEIDWWFITGSPMTFENIAFSRPVSSESSSSSNPKVKLLACAECELGALGWCKEGGNEYWVAVTRVAYK